MARTPNYGYERKERERQKALKKADKLAAKQEAKDKRVENPEPDALSTPDLGDR
jgi:hypothetical protein